MEEEKCKHQKIDGISKIRELNQSKIIIKYERP